CLVPAAITLLWSLRWADRSPEWRLAALIGGMGLRMVVVLGGGVALYLSVPLCHDVRFWLWVAGSYLLTLTLETTLMVSSLHVNPVPNSGSEQATCMSP